MPALAIRTEVYAPPSEVFAFLRDFPGYAAYSSHLTDVRQYGDGGVGTEYELDAAWWRLEYTARTEVTDIDEHERIEWKVVDDLDARGAWIVDGEEPTDEPTQVTLFITYGTTGTDSLPISLPRFVSVQTVVNRLKPVIRREATETVERVVAELEGEPRSVTLEIDTDPAAGDQ